MDWVTTVGLIIDLSEVFSSLKRLVTTHEAVELTGGGQLMVTLLRFSRIHGIFSLEIAFACFGKFRGRNAYVWVNDSSWLRSSLLRSVVAVPYQ